MAAGPLRYSSSVCQFAMMPAQEAAQLSSGAAPTGKARSSRSGRVASFVCSFEHFAVCVCCGGSASALFPAGFETKSRVFCVAVSALF